MNRMRGRPGDRLRDQVGADLRLGPGGDERCPGAARAKATGSCSAAAFAELAPGSRSPARRHRPAVRHPRPLATPMQRSLRHAGLTARPDPRLSSRNVSADRMRDTAFRCPCGIAGWGGMLRPPPRPAPGFDCAQCAEGPEAECGPFRLPVPIPSPRRRLAPHREVLHRASVRGACWRGSRPGNGRHADGELDGDRRLGLPPPAGLGPAVKVTFVVDAGTVLLRRPQARSVWCVC